MRITFTKFSRSYLCKCRFIVQLFLLLHILIPLSLLQVHILQYNIFTCNFKYIILFLQTLYIKMA